MFILLMFFSQVSKDFTVRHIVVGQYLGFIFMMILTAAGVACSLLLPKEAIGFLGFVPLVIGVKKVFEKPDHSTPNTVPGQMEAPNLLSALFDKRTYTVAVVTTANSGDNLALYIPVFATSTPFEATIIFSTFVCLVGLWCLLAHKLTTHPLSAEAIKVWGARLTPYLLITIGTDILNDSGVLDILYEKLIH